MSETLEKEVEEVKELIDNRITSDHKNSFELAENLITKMKFLKQIVSNNPTVPILENVFFDNGKMFTSDLQTSLAFKTSIIGTFLIPFKTFFDAVSACGKTDRISIHACKDTYKVTVYVNGVPEFKLSGENPLDFPKIPMAVKKFGDLDRKTILVINSMLEFVTNDELRPAMTGVYLSDKNIVGTNAHLLGFCRGKFFEEELEIIVPPKAVKALNGFENAQVRLMSKTYKKEEEEVTFYEHICFNDLEKAIFSRLIDERYPNVDAVIPTEHHFSTILNVKKLEPVLKKANVCANKTTHQVALTLTEDNVHVFSQDLDFSHEYNGDVKANTELISFEKEVPVYVFNEEGAEVTAKDENGNTITEKKMITDSFPMRIGFNCNFVLSILKSVGADEVKLLTSAPNRAGIFIGTSSKKDTLTKKVIEIENHVLLMPVMLSS